MPGPSLREPIRATTLLLLLLISSLEVLASKAASSPHPKGPPAPAPPTGVAATVGSAAEDAPASPGAAIEVDVSGALPSSLSQPLAPAAMHGGSPSSLGEQPLSALTQPLSKLSDSVLGGTVLIEPSYLEFKQRPLCIPAVESTEIINTSESDDLDVLTVTTDNVHFHPSDVKPTTLKPGERLSISIVFLPRLVGEVHGTLVIQTSAGGFPYRIRAHGVANPYKIHPFLSARVPVGSMYSPPIQLYNPLDEKLQINEVFTSEGFLHLNLPQGSVIDGMPQGLWEVPPGKIKTIINVAFSSDSPGKYQGYVHVKTNFETMIIPLEIVVFRGGPYRATVEMLDFGTLTAPGKTASLPLRLSNAVDAAVEVVGVSHAPSVFLSVVFERNTMLAPKAETEVATLVFRGREEGLYAGSVSVRLNDVDPANTRLEIPFKARVLHGQLDWTGNTSFAFGDAALSANRTFKLKNLFAVPIQILSVTVLDPNFVVHDSHAGLIMSPMHSAEVVTLQFAPDALQQNMSELLFVAELEIETNATTLHIPLNVFHGQLQVAVHEENRIPSVASFTYPVGPNRTGMALDLGNVAVGQPRVSILSFRNPNPVPISLLSCSSTMAGLVVSLKMMLDSDYDMTSVRGSAQYNVPLCSGGGPVPLFQLEREGVATMQLEVTASTSEISIGSLDVVTDFESLSFPVKFVGLTGTVTFVPPSRDETVTFPGLMLRCPIIALSTYPVALLVLTISSSDSKLLPMLTKTVLEPNEETELGYVRLDTSKVDTLVKHQTHGMHSATFLQKLTRMPASPTDVEFLSLLHKRWTGIAETNLRASLSLKTHLIPSSKMDLKATIVWPRITNPTHHSAGLVQVGTNALMYIKVVNPSPVWLYVELADIVVKSDNGSTVSPFTTISDEGDVDYATAAYGSDSPLTELVRSTPFRPELFTASAGARSNHVLRGLGHSAIIGPIYFNPDSVGKARTWLFLRNNLTGIEELMLSGEGGSGELVLHQTIKDAENKKLLISITDEDLHCDTDGEGDRSSDPTRAFTNSFQQNFTFANRGNVKMEVHGMNLEGTGCSARGFSLPDCPRSSVLAPGHELHVQAAFETDFTTPMVSAQLQLVTSLGVLSFELEANLPRALLSACYSERMRHNRSVPSERRLRSVVLAIVFILFAALLQLVVQELNSGRGAMLKLVSSKLSAGPCKTARIRDEAISEASSALPGEAPERTPKKADKEAREKAPEGIGEISSEKTDGGTAEDDRDMRAAAARPPDNEPRSSAVEDGDETDSKKATASAARSPQPDVKLPSITPVETVMSGSALKSCIDDKDTTQSVAVERMADAGFAASHAHPGSSCGAHASSSRVTPTQPAAQTPTPTIHSPPAATTHGSTARTNSQSRASLKAAREGVERGLDKSSTQASGAAPAETSAQCRHTEVVVQSRQSTKSRELPAVSEDRRVRVGEEEARASRSSALPNGPRPPPVSGRQSPTSAQTMSKAASQRAPSSSLVASPVGSQEHSSQPSTQGHSSQQSTQPPSPQALNSPQLQHPHRPQPQAAAPSALLPRRDRLSGQGDDRVSAEEPSPSSRARDVKSGRRDKARMTQRDSAEDRDDSFQRRAADVEQQRRGESERVRREKEKERDDRRKEPERVERAVKPETASTASAPKHEARGSREMDTKSRRDSERTRQERLSSSMNTVLESEPRQALARRRDDDAVEPARWRGTSGTDEGQARRLSDEGSFRRRETGGPGLGPRDATDAERGGVQKRPSTLEEQARQIEEERLRARRETDRSSVTSAAEESAGAGLGALRSHGDEVLARPVRNVGVIGGSSVIGKTAVTSAAPAANMVAPCGSMHGPSAGGFCDPWGGQPSSSTAALCQPRDPFTSASRGALFSALPDLSLSLPPHGLPPPQQSGAMSAGLSSAPAISAPSNPFGPTLFSAAPGRASAANLASSGPSPSSGTVPASDGGASHASWSSFRGSGTSTTSAAGAGAGGFHTPFGGSPFGGFGSAALGSGLNPMLGDVVSYHSATTSNGCISGNGAYTSCCGSGSSQNGSCGSTDAPAGGLPPPKSRSCGNS